MYNNLFISDVSKLSRDSHAKVNIDCSSQSSKNCKKIIMQEYREIMDVIENNNGIYICSNCTKKLKFSNNNSNVSSMPNDTYNIYGDMFKNLTKENCYLLGWICSSNTTIKNNQIEIETYENDIICLNKLKNIICEDLNIFHRKNKNKVYLSFYSSEITKDICNLLNISFNKNSNDTCFPELKEDELNWVFLRGLFEGNGDITNLDKNNSLSCRIIYNSESLLKSIEEFTKIPCKIYKNKITFYGVNCLDFMGKIYDNCGDLYLFRKYKSFQHWLLINWQPSIKSGRINLTIPKCYVYKTDINAVIPSKFRLTDAGYDITIIRKHKQFNKVTTLYDTGIKLNIKLGYYVEIMARSSLSKTGYMLANNTAIIDNNYRGNIYIPLTKIDPDADDIKLPFRCCQMIFRKQEYVELIETCEEFDNTVRNSGGFGSTG